MSETQPTTPDAAMLQEFLRERDVTCPRCEYNLRNLIGSRCPECGDELVLRVNLSEPKMAAFFTGLVGLAAGAGFSGLLVVYALVVVLIYDRSWRSFWNSFFFVTSGGFLVLGVAVLIWIRARYYIRRQGYGRQWMLAAGCWCLTLANLVVFTKMIR